MRYQKILILFVSLVVVLGVSIALAEWSAPPCAPSLTCNRPAPINETGTAQSKEGRLTVGTNMGIGEVALLVPNGKVIIGADGSSSSDKLYVDGKINAQQFCIENPSGDICKSAWITSVSGSGGLSGTGTSGNITLNITNPNLGCTGSQQYMKSFDLSKPLSTTPGSENPVCVTIQ